MSVVAFMGHTEVFWLPTKLVEISTRGQRLLDLYVRSVAEVEVYSDIVYE